MGRVTFNIIYSKYVISLFDGIAAVNDKFVLYPGQFTDSIGGNISGKSACRTILSKLMFIENSIINLNTTLTNSSFNSSPQQRISNIPKNNVLI